MDIDLGAGISGPEAAERILNICPIPIVFLTSHSERDMVDKVRGITRYGYIIKDSGDFVLQSSIEMAYELFEAHQAQREAQELYEKIFRLSPELIVVTTEILFFFCFCACNERLTNIVSPSVPAGLMTLP